jgi:hypothetical protein
VPAALRWFDAHPRIAGSLPLFYSELHRCVAEGRVSGTWWSANLAISITRVDGLEHFHFALLSAVLAVKGSDTSCARPSIMTPALELIHCGDLARRISRRSSEPGNRLLPIPPSYPRLSSSCWTLNTGAGDVPDESCAAAIAGREANHTDVGNAFSLGRSQQAIARLGFCSTAVNCNLRIRSWRCAIGSFGVRHNLPIACWSTTRRPCAES